MEEATIDTPLPLSSDMPKQEQKAPLQFQVGSTPGKVILAFSESTSYVELFPHVAEAFAKALKHHAHKARRVINRG